MKGEGIKVDVKEATNYQKLAADYGILFGMIKYVDELINGNY